jgi:hypothetical protein
MYVVILATMPRGSNSSARAIHVALLGFSGLTLCVLAIGAFAFAARSPAPEKWRYATIGLIAAIIGLLEIALVPAIG